MSQTTVEPSVVNTDTSSPQGGPLGSLYQSGYGSPILKYPQDLESSQKGHMAVFTACVTKPAGYDENSSYSLPDVTGDNLNNVSNVDEKTDLTFQPKRIKSSDVIALYMPETIQFQLAASYATVSLKDAITEAAGALPGVLGKIAKGATSMVDSGVAKLGMNAAGYAINPQQQLLFDGIDFRSYQMAFTFTPRNQSESQTVRDIIKKFRSHASPVIQTGAKSMAFIVPDSFIIQFFQIGAGQNQYITKLKESVLTGVDVNYSPNGIWSAHADGSPTQIQMTLQFKEIALVDRTAIENGF